MPRALPRVAAISRCTPGHRATNPGRHDTHGDRGYLGGVTRYLPPVEFEELDHTADVGIVVRGASAEETLARLVLAFSELLSGGAAPEESALLAIALEPADLPSLAVDTLRELLFRFDAEAMLPTSVTVLELGVELGARLNVGVGAYDPELHAEGLELKAVTLHEARFERSHDGYLAQIVFDI